MKQNQDASTSRWPVVRQLMDKDVLGLGANAASSRSDTLQARTGNADRVVASVCPYCAVGCGQLVYVKNNKIIDIEGDPRSPISNGCLCPKGAATFQLVTGSHRVQHVLYRRPHATEWEQIPLETAMDMVAERVKNTRDRHWETHEKEGKHEVSQQRFSFRISQSVSAFFSRFSALFCSSSSSTMSLFHSGCDHNRRYRRGIGSFHQPALSCEARRPTR